MRNRHAAAFLLAVLSVAPVRAQQKALIAVPAQEQIFDKTVPLAPDGTLRIENLNGSVQVRGWDRPEVQVHAVKLAGRDPGDLAAVAIDVTATPARVTIATRYPEDKGVDVNVDYEVRVPYRSLLEHVATVNGNVGISNIETTGDLRTVNGNILAYNCAGGLSAHTTNGSIYEELASLAASGATLETVNGSVVVAIAPNAGADLDVHSMNGTTTSEVPFFVQSAAERGHVTGRIGAGGPKLFMRALNGLVQIQALKPTA